VQLATDFMTWLYLHDDLWVDGVQRDPSALEQIAAAKSRSQRASPQRMTLAAQA
jgi:hypothetical protein